MSYSNFTTKLGEILEAVRTAPGSVLATWYSYPEPESDSTPYATIDQTGATERPLDTMNNVVEYEFRVRIIGRDLGKAQGGRPALEAALRQCVDDITAEMRKKSHILLDGTSTRAYAITTEWGSAIGQQPSVRYAEITITIEEIFPIS